MASRIDEETLTRPKHRPSGSPKPRVLLVDDQLANLVALEAVLAPLGHDLVSVRSGAEALAQLEGGDFAVVLLDVQMPTMDGFQTALAMRRLLHQTAHRTPIIFLTAIDADPGRIASAYDHGAVDFIQKPFDPQVLRAKVGVFVELYRARQRLVAEREEAGQRLRALADLGLALSRARTLVEVTDVVVDHGMQFARADTCTLYLLDPGGEGLDLVGHRGVDPAVIEAIRRITDTSGNPRLMVSVRNGASLWAENPSEYGAMFPSLATLKTSERRAKAFWSVPLVVENRTIGLLGMGFYEARAFSDDERAFVGTFAKQCGQALQRALLLAREEKDALAARRDSARRDFLAVAGEALVSSLDYRETLTTIARLAVPQLADWCAVDLLEPGAREPEQLAVAHVDPAKLELARELREGYPPDRNATTGAREVIRTGRPELYPELPAEVLEAGARDARHLDLIRRLKLESAMVVPLTAHGRTLGAMTFLYADSGRRYSESDLAFASDFARRAAMAIENTLALRDAEAAREAERQARDRIARMQEITASMSRARTAAEVAGAVCEIGARALDALTGALWIRRDDGALELAGSSGIPPTLVDQFRVIAPDAKGTPALEVLRTGEALWIETEEDYRRVAPEIFERASLAGHVLSYGALPLSLDGTVAGVIVFAHPLGHRFDDDERRFYATLTHHCAQALHRARLLDAERQANERLRLLASAGETLARSLDLDETMQAVARLAVPGFCDWCVVDLVEGDEIRRVATVHSNHELAEAAHVAARGRPARLGDDGGVARVIAERTPRFFPRVPAEALARGARTPQHLAFLEKARVVSSIVLPLIAGDVCFGALSFTTAESQRVFGEDDLQFAQEIGHRAALAIANARLYRSAQVAVERAEDANRIKDEFLATVSHELRTPLNAINGWAVLLADNIDDRASVEKGLEVIRRNARTQTKIVEDILDVSRIVTGKMKIDVAPVDVVAIVREALEVVRPSADARAITLSLRTLPDRDWLLVADAMRLQQVMWNLLTNAIKFTDPGGDVAVEVDHDGQNVILSVADTGNGIDPDFLPHVFDRFRQADGSTTRRFGGLGLGLAIVRHIVELHGGRVAVESPGAGKGATFTIVLPVRAAVPSAAEDHVSVVREG